MRLLQCVVLTFNQILHGRHVVPHGSASDLSYGATEVLVCEIPAAEWLATSTTGTALVLNVVSHFISVAMLCASNVYGLFVTQLSFTDHLLFSVKAHCIVGTR